MAQNIGLEAEVRDLTEVIQDLSAPVGGVETDPVFTASDAFPITTADITNWNSKEAGGAAAAALVSANAYTDSEIAALTKADVGLGNVDNTSDLAKPISTATQSALDLKANALGADDNYVTDAEKGKLSNLSGTNTGDQNLAPYFNKSVDDSDDITEGATKLFLTGAERTKLTATSGTNTGDQVLPTRTSLGIDNVENTALSTGNAGTATALQTPRKINGVDFDGTAPISFQSTAGAEVSPIASSTQTITHNLGRTPTRIRIYGVGQFVANSAATPTPMSMGIWNSTGNRCVYMTSAGTATQAAQISTVFAVFIATTSGANISGVIGNVGATTFDIVWTETGSAIAQGFLWEAE